MRRCDVVQGVVLQGRRRRVELRADGKRMGGAVSWSGADGADSFGGGLQRYRRTFVEAVFFRSRNRNRSDVFREWPPGYGSSLKSGLWSSAFTCWGCVSWRQHQEAPSAAQRSLERKPAWCSAGGARAGTGTGLEFAWPPAHSGATPSAAGEGLPDNRAGER